MYPKIFFLFLFESFYESSVYDVTKIAIQLNTYSHFNTLPYSAEFTIINLLVSLSYVASLVFFVKISASLSSDRTNLIFIVPSST